MQLQKKWPPTIHLSFSYSHHCNPLFHRVEVIFWRGKTDHVTLLVKHFMGFCCNESKIQAPFQGPQCLLPRFPEFRFSTLFPTLSSSLLDYHSVHVTILIPTSGLLPILFPLGTFSQDHSAGSYCYFTSELKCHLLRAIAYSAFWSWEYFQVPESGKDVFWGQRKSWKVEPKSEPCVHEKLDSMCIISIFHLRKVLIKTYLWIISSVFLDYLHHFNLMNQCIERSQFI